MSENTQVPQEKKEKRKLSQSIVQFYKEHKAELDKIVWPNRKDLTKQTITVIITSLFFALVIFVIDTVYSVGYNFIF